ncbi:MAG: HD domain-containing protein [Acidobacteriota bacterium]|nr:HD domain-containing protein [Acidobacteriota bacterium]
MATRDIAIFDVIETRFPGLVAAVREIIRESERAYEGDGGGKDSFLWEHTMHVASIAEQLARSENIDPLVPVVAALFHDAGKFAGGRYHEEGTIEEEESAHIAEPLLRQFGMKASDMNRTLAGLRALYNENLRKNRIAAIIHDADFLSKFGAMGVASFFIKSTLRGRTLRISVLEYLSKELTYAACLPLNMRTDSGRKLANRKAADSMRFFRSLLAELKSARIADLRIRSLRIPSASSRNKFLSIRLAVSPTCLDCGEDWEMAWATEDGVKCHKLSVDWSCPHCGKRLETSFCLPEIA